MAGTLDHSPADIIRSLLIALSQGTTPSDSGAWPIFATHEPNTPDSVITVYDTGGIQHGRTQIDGQQQEHHGIQVRVRDANHVDGYAKARAIAISMDESAYQNTVSIGSSTYAVHSISRRGDVLVLGKDPNSKRNIFTINVLVAMRKAA